MFMLQFGCLRICYFIGSHFHIFHSELAAEAALLLFACYEGILWRESLFSYKQTMSLVGSRFEWVSVCNSNLQYGWIGSYFTWWFKEISLYHFFFFYHFTLSICFLRHKRIQVFLILYRATQADVWGGAGWAGVPSCANAFRVGPGCALGLSCILFLFIWMRANVRFPWLGAACMLDDPVLGARGGGVVPGPSRSVWAAWRTQAIIDLLTEQRETALLPGLE